MLHSIERITAKQAETLFKDHLLEQKPVIIKDLYPGHPLLLLNSPDKMAQEMGDTELLVGQNFYDKFLSEDSTPKFKDYSISLEKYLSLIRETPSLELLCREQRVPQELHDRYPLLPKLVETVSQPDPIQMMYVANNKTVAPLHFDLDLREVLFTQVAGAKEIFLVSPEYGARLLPIRNFSGIPTYKFSEIEKKEFFSYCHAHHCVLESGETLYIPKLWWHQLENIGITMAFSVRFGASPHMRQLGLLPFNYLTQNILKSLLHPLTGLVKDDALLKKMMAIYYSTYASELERAQTLWTEWKKIVRDLCPQAVQTEYAPYWFTEEIWKNSEKLKIFLGLREVRSLSAEDVTLPASPQAQEALKESFRRHGYTDSYVFSVRESLNLPREMDQMTLLESTILHNSLEERRQQRLASTSKKPIY